jgi:succinate-semialdehyde dehydrogenase/glutarate-semialdehyde dehydrogenase
MTKRLAAQMYIGGSWCEAADGGTYTTINPATEQAIAQVPSATADDVDRAILASEKGFRTWRDTDPWSRSEVLRQVAVLLRDRSEGIAAVMTEEQGKPLREARAELKGAWEQFDWFADEARRISASIVATSDSQHEATVRREPIGPVAAFAPWNFPALLLSRKVAPALAAGCSVILKPADETPLTAFAIASACEDAALPAGVLNVITGDAPMISKRLLTSPAIRKVTLTGSVPVGQLLLRLAADNVIDATMELGGHAPVVVMPGADATKAAQACAAAKFRNAGQVCISPTRFFVHRDSYEEFSEQFVAVASALQLGDGQDPDTEVGPLSTQRRVTAINDLVQDAVAAGATLATGGAARAGEVGFFYEPTVLLDVPDDARVMREEPFGPLALLTSYGDLEDAVSRANATSFGLAAYVVAPDLADGHAIARQLEAGMVGINHFALSYAGVPFGGVKTSGIGTESGSAAIDAFLVHKSIHASDQSFV